MHTMAGLLADFIIEESAYVNAHLDDFTWEGVDIYAFDKNGKKCGLGYPIIKVPPQNFNKTVHSVFFNTLL